MILNTYKINALLAKVFLQNADKSVIRQAWCKPGSEEEGIEYEKIQLRNKHRTLKHEAYQAPNALYTPRNR
jgi:hypothetical protein